MGFYTNLNTKLSYFSSLKPCWRHASYKITAVALDKFKLREFGAIGKRIQCASEILNAHFQVNHEFQVPLIMQ